MCCIANKNAKQEFLADMKLKNRKTFTAWKILMPNGHAAHVDYQYGPGVHEAQIKGRYRTKRPRGIHVFIEKPIWYPWKEDIIPVQCNVNDFVRMDEPSGSQQAVLTKVVIHKKDWKQFITTSH